MACLTSALPLCGQTATGPAIYEKHCATCHGANGEGVEEECEDPLEGDRSLASLTRYIDKRMPEDDPHVVVGEDAKQVAEYIYGAFYSPAARAGRVAAVKPAFARLTNRQFRESVADLLGSFSGISQPGEGKGLQARYFQSDGMNKKSKQVIERQDRALSFDFGEGPPVEGISPDQFSIEWQGALLAPTTGWYEFNLITPNGARLYLNMEAQEGDGNYRDDSGAKRQTALIDSWVSSGPDLRESHARVFLLGGRSYPFKLDYFKYKEARGMVRLDWKMPRGEWEVLSAPNLSPAAANRVAVVSTSFPPDDSSEGYERGTEISKAWHEATTQAALEISGEVVARLTKLSGVPENDPDRINRLKGFIATLAERAFRRPLGGEELQLYVERPFSGDTPPESR